MKEVIIHLKEDDEGRITSNTEIKGISLLAVLGYLDLAREQLLGQLQVKPLIKKTTNEDSR